MIDVRIEGLKEGLEDVIEKLVYYTVFDIESRAKDYCPYKTGELSRSIKGEKTGVDSGRVAAHKGYAGYVEFGHGFPAEEPFVPGTELTTWPALEARGGYHQTIPFMRPAVYSFIAHAESLSPTEWKTKLK